jgi:diaminopimelate decarboxylase
VIKDHLIIDGTPALEIIEKYGNPLYIFLEQRIRENCQKMLTLSKKHFKSSIYYSYKANYLDAVCKIITEEGLGAEVATEYEYQLAIQNNNPKSIILSAPYKSPSFLQRVLTDNIGLIFITHLDEIAEIAQYTKKKQDIGIRLRSLRPNKQIGLEIKDDSIQQIISNLSNAANLSLTTLQLHSGTQLDNQNFKNGINHLFNVANQLEQQGITISQIDFGGGFPESSLLPEDELENLFLLLSENLHDRGWQKVTCIFEPGRYIVGDAGLLLAQIIRVFKVGKTPWMMLNTGNHHCPKFSGSNFRYELIDRISEPHNTPTSIAGCMPTDMDVLAKHYPFLKNVRKDDYIAIFNAGAYTISWSTRFSYPFPPMVLINGIQMTPIYLPKIV